MLTSRAQESDRKGRHGGEKTGNSRDPEKLPTKVGNSTPLSREAGGSRYLSKMIPGHR